MYWIQAFLLTNTRGAIEMRFRFGWRKEQKNDNPIKELLNEYLEINETEEMLLQDIATPTRILLFGNQEEISSLYSLFLRSKGYEVLHFPSPTTCALINNQTCTCPRDHVCADMIIADMDMEGMTGLELIRHQDERGCRALPEHKAVISKGLTYNQEREAAALGCKTLLKPFRLMDMMEWVRKCEQGIRPERKLTPVEDLLGLKVQSGIIK
jgi:CheY-like chemotaxis protein